MMLISCENHRNPNGKVNGFAQTVLRADALMHAVCACYKRLEDLPYSGTGMHEPILSLMRASLFLSDLAAHTSGG